MPKEQVDSPQDRLYADPRLADFYDLDNDWGDDLECCLSMADTADSVLDLGCGTGRFAARVADTRRVVGVDPAAAMLDVARNRPGGERVEWIASEAALLDLPHRFDLVVMTGHAFQVLLDDAAQDAVLGAISRHLADDGRFVFDTRNPRLAEWREWTPELSMRALNHPTLGAVTAWNDASWDEDAAIVTYETCYRIEASGEMLRAHSRIRFSPRARIEAALEGAGLRVDRWLGDWQGSPISEYAPEIIPIGCRVESFVP